MDGCGRAVDIRPFWGPSIHGKREEDNLHDNRRSSRRAPVRPHRCVQKHVCTLCNGEPKVARAYRVPNRDKSRIVSDDEASKQFERIRAGLIELLGFAEKKAFADMHAR
jgi:hypothetical protein